MMPNLFDERLQLGCQSLIVRQVLRERVLGADGLPNAVDSDGTSIDTARDSVVIGAGLTKVGIHELERRVTHVHAGEDPKTVHLLARRRANTMEFSNKEILNESRAHLRRDDELAIDGLQM